MGRRCIVCDHPRVADIEGDMAAGMGLLPLAAKYGVSKSVMARHRTAHLAPKLAAAARLTAPVGVVQAERRRAKAIAAGAAPTGSDVLALTGLLERLARSLERLEAAADKTAADNLPAALAAVSGQLHRGIEAAARIQGLYAEPKPAGEGAGLTVIINVPDGKPLTLDHHPAWEAQGAPVAAGPGDEDAPAPAVGLSTTMAPWPLPPFDLKA